MSETLVLRLSAWPDERAAWVPVDDTGALVGPTQIGDLADAASCSNGRQLVVLLPAVDVLRTETSVPLKPGGKLLQALPFALEEHLADDIDDLHFAAGPRTGRNGTPVAVTRRELMDSVLTRLGRAGLTPAKLYSEADAVGALPNCATLVIQSDCAVLADSNGELGASDLQSLDAFLDLWAGRRLSDPADPSVPARIVIYGADEDLRPLESLWDGLRSRLDSVDVHAMQDGALPRMAAHIATNPGLNLLQGSYAQRGSLAGYWPAWRATAALLGTLAILATLTQWLELQQMRREGAALDMAIDQSFHYVFPDADKVADARSELSARLRDLGARSAADSGDFLGMLKAVAEATKSAGPVRIEGVNFRSGTLELRLRVASVEILDSIQQKVVKAGLEAQIQSANASGGEVVGRLQIVRSQG